MADAGLDFLVKKAGTAIAGCRENGLSFDGSPVDITNKGSGGYRELADFAGVKSLDISASGVWLDDVVRAAAMGSSLLLDDITITFADGATLSGDFYLASYEEESPHDAEVTFTATLQSSGAWAYTGAV